MILAIDLGSTSFKAGVFNDALECVGSGAADLTYQYAPDGVVELDPAHVVDAVRQAAGAALGPVTPLMPASILQTVKTDVYVTETAAMNIETNWDIGY